MYINGTSVTLAPAVGREVQAEITLSSLMAQARRLRL